MKKVLILTASTGDGHNKAAESLEDVFSANNYRAIKFDFLKHSSQLLNTFVVDGYKLLAFNFPRLYGNLYKVSDFNWFNSKVSSILLNIIEKCMLDAINREQPDIIVSTHPLAVSTVSRLKKRNIIDVPFVSIVTDFKAHYTYIDDGVDAYVTGSEYTKSSIINRNIPKYKIHSFGIPIRKEFLSNSELKEKLPGEYFNILLMGGGMGLRFITPVLKKLMENEHKLKITIVCGNNKALKGSLDEEFNSEVHDKEIHILGFTRNIPELMDEADVIITKPGGLTVSEAIAKRLPMILPYAIPGQEQENLDFLVNSGTAVDARKLDNLNVNLNNLLENPEVLFKMRNNLDAIFKDYSIGGIVELSDRLIKNNRGFQYFQNNLIEALR